MCFYTKRVRISNFPMGQSFWPKDSLITHNYAYLEIWPCAQLSTFFCSPSTKDALSNLLNHFVHKTITIFCTKKKKKETDFVDYTYFCSMYSLNLQGMKKRAFFLYLHIKEDLKIWRTCKRDTCLEEMVQRN